MAAIDEAVAAPVAAAEEVLVAVPTDNQNKRKLEDLEPESVGDAAESESKASAVAGGDSEPDNNNKTEEEEGSEAKRPRLEEVHAAENGHEKDKEVDETSKEESEQPVNVENNVQSEDGHEESKETSTTVTSEQPAADDQQTGDTQQPSVENEEPKDETAQGQSTEEGKEVSADDVQEGGEQQSVSETQTISRKMEVPNNKVGVLIGKAGDTIRYLQYNSGAKIQITRDAEADPHAPTRLVELIGTSDSINKAEKLIKDVIAEADVGGSPALVARGFSTVQAITGEQLEIQVPNEKVGLIIGKGGETIKSLQTRSGARIQLIPQHPPEGDHSKERTVRVTGDRKQIDIAREMIKEVMNQTVRQSPLSSGYGQQGFRPRGPAAPQWGPRSGHSSHFTGYDHQQRGPYPSQNQQYPPPAYNNYPPQSAGRGSYGPGWESRPPAQGPPPQGNYNYGQQQGSEYGQPAPYSQTAGYGHGYNDGHGGPQQHQYPGHSGSQPAAYHQGGGPYPGYNAQDQYAKQQPSYGMQPQQAPHAQPYVQPRANQPGTQSYAPNVPPQQSYPYAGNVPTQQSSYPTYGAAPAVDGYSHAQPTPVAGSYPQQAGQPVSGYAQPGAQQPTGYGQVAAQGGYGSYPSQPAYTDQAAATNAGYGYQGQAETTTYGTAPSSGAYVAQPTAQAGYAQPAPVQQAYDQSATTQQSGYGAAPAPAPAPAAYGKTVAPQPGYAQYDASQTYGAQHH